MFGKWTLCVDDLPKDGQDVLATVDGVNMSVLTYHDRRENKWEDDYGYYVDDVLAWMPLPEPYTE